MNPNLLGRVARSSPPSPGIEEAVTSEEESPIPVELSKLKKMKISGCFPGASQGTTSTAGDSDESNSEPLEMKGYRPLSCVEIHV